MRRLTVQFRANEDPKTDGSTQFRPTKTFKIAAARFKSGDVLRSGRGSSKEELRSKN